MVENKLLLPVIALALCVISSSGLNDVQTTGGSRRAVFGFQGNGNLEIGYRKRSCHYCTFLLFFSHRCSDDTFHLSLTFENGKSEGYRGTPDCGNSNWLAIHISPKFQGIRIGNKIASFSNHISKQSLLRAKLTVSSTNYMEWKVIMQDEPELSTTAPVTQAPPVNIAAVLGATSGGLILALIITAAVVCYRKKRRSQEEAPDDGKEFQDYEDVTNLEEIYTDVTNCEEMYVDVTNCEEIYADVTNTAECDYDNAECFYSNPDCVYEKPRPCTVNISQGGQQVKFQPSG